MRPAESSRNFALQEARVGHNLNPRKTMSEQPVKPGAKIVLVVDDDRVVLRAMSFALKAEGYQVSMASGGAEAISSAHKQKPDLILLDLVFPPDPANIGGPIRDGFQIIEWLRRTPEDEKIPIIIISATDPAVYKDRALAAGVVACFHKPLNRDEVLAAVQSVLGKQSSTA
jgi:CheY-like chemotaxis protein